jgi:8-oxo-dGTP pyrophosphatase MutT (NUDIX family)
MKIRGLSAEQVDARVTHFATLMQMGMEHVCDMASMAAITADAASSGELTTAIDGLSIMTTQWGDYTTGTLLPELGKIATEAAKAVATPLGTVPTIKTEQFLTDMRNTITSFSSEMWTTAKTALITGVQDGASIAELSDAVASVAKIKEKKAHVIAQTAVIAAINGGEWQQMMAMTAGLDLKGMKEWEATEDEHTRLTHHEADGQRVPIDGHFVVGGSFLLFPGDPTGEPGEIISCRCTTLYDLDVDDEITASTSSPETLSATGPVDTDGLSAAVNAEFNAQHPRGKNGQFIKKGEGLPSVVFTALADLRAGDDPKTAWPFDEKEDFVNEFMHVTPEQWHNLKDEDKSHLQNLVDASVAAGVLGSSKAQSHIDDLDDADPGDISALDVFDPNIPLFDAENGGLPSDDVIAFTSKLDDLIQQGGISKEQKDSVVAEIHAVGLVSANEYLNEILGENGYVPTTLPESNAKDAAKKAWENGEISKIGLAELENLIDVGAWDNETALKKLEEMKAHKAKSTLNTPIAPAPLTTGQSTPIKITHGLIHAKHTPGTVIAQSKPNEHGDVTKVTWNGSEYDITITAGQAGANSNDTVKLKSVKKSKLYAELNSSTHSYKKWVTPGKQETEVSHATPLAAAPPANPIPHPIHQTPVAPWPTTPGLVNDNSDPFDASSAQVQVAQKLTSAQGQQLQEQMKPVSSWTDAQKKAVADYGVYSSAINEMLRKKQESQHPDLVAKSDILSSVMSPLPTEVHATRSTIIDALPEHLRTYDIATLKAAKGTKWTEPGFSSSTIGGEKHQYVGGAVMFKIEAEPGTKAAFIKDAVPLKGENELLFDKNLEYEIVDARAPNPATEDALVVITVRVRSHVAAVNNGTAPVNEPPSVGVSTIVPPVTGSPSPFHILADTGKNGDGYAAPGLWGKYGAAGVMIKNTDENGVERYLMVQRGPGVENKGIWQLAGGAIDSKETPEQGAAREIFEEIGAPQEYLSTMQHKGTHAVAVPIAGKDDWVYHNIAAEAPTMFKPKVDGTETGDAKWLTKDEIQVIVDDGKMHPALAKELDKVFALYDGNGNTTNTTPVVTPSAPSPASPMGDNTPDLIDQLNDAVVTGKISWADHKALSEKLLAGDTAGVEDTLKYFNAPSSPIVVTEMSEPTPSSIFGDIAGLDANQLTQLDNVWKAYTKGLMTKAEAADQVAQIKNPPVPAHVSVGNVAPVGTKISTLDDIDTAITNAEVDTNAPFAVGTSATGSKYELFKNDDSGFVVLKTPFASSNTSQLVAFDDVHAEMQYLGMTHLELTKPIAGITPTVTPTSSPLDDAFSAYDGGHTSDVDLGSAIMNITQADWDATSQDVQYNVIGTIINLDNNELAKIGTSKKDLNKKVQSLLSGATSTPSTPAPVTPAAPVKTQAKNLTSAQQETFYKAFKDEKVSFAFSGKKIYESIHAAKLKHAGDPGIAGLSDREMLKVLDIVESKKGATTNTGKYEQKVTDWLKTPNGVKAFKQINPAIPGHSPAVAKKVMSHAAKKGAVKKAAVPIASVTPAQALGFANPMSLTDAESASIYASFKSASHGTSQQTHKPEALFWNAVQQSKTHGVSPAQILTAVDIESTKKFHAPDPNKHLYENTVTDWLNTTSGQQIAAQILAGTWSPPTPAKKTSSGYGYGGSTVSSQNYTHPANTPLSDKIPNLSGGVPPFDPNDTTKYPIISTHEASSLWTDMQAAHGNMTGTQKASLRYYTSNTGFSLMNKYLRGKQGASDETLKHVKAAQDGMKPTTKPIVLHRGSGWFTSGSSNQQWTSYENIKALEGGPFHNESFFSASVGGHAAFGGNIKFEIECPVGTPMAYVKAFSQYGGENEMLIAGDVTFQILNVEKISGTVHVKMRAIAPGSGGIA